jgi:hypothetical protein
MYLCRITLFRNHRSILFRLFSMTVHDSYLGLSELSGVTTMNMNDMEIFIIWKENLANIMCIWKGSGEYCVATNITNQNIIFSRSELVLHSWLIGTSYPADACKLLTREQNGRTLFKYPAMHFGPLFSHDGILQPFSISPTHPTIWVIHAYICRQSLIDGYRQIRR